MHVSEDAMDPSTKYQTAVQAATMTNMDISNICH